MIEKALKRYKNLSQEVKASFWFLICGFIQRGISLITTPIFSRLLSTSEYGDFSVFNTWMSVVTIFATLNLASGVYVRGLVKYDDDRKKFTGSLESLFLLCAAICFCVYMLFQDFWNGVFDLDSPFVYVMFVDIIVVAAFHFWSAQQRVDVKYVNLVIFTVINAILRPLAGVIAILLFPDFKLEARIYSMVLVDIVTFDVFFARIFKNGLKVLTTKYWKYALAFNLPLVPHYLSQIILNHSDRLMIKSLVGSSEAGIYSLAYSLASIMVIANTAVINTLTPWMYKKMKAKAYKDIGNNTLPILIFIAFINLTLTAFAPEAIAIFSPSSYHDAIWIVPPVAASTYFIFMYSLFGNFEFYFDKTRFMLIASVSGAALNIVLNYIFIQIYGYYAAGYTTLVCYLLYCVGHYILMRRINKNYMDGVKVYNVKALVGISLVFVLLCGLMMVFYTVFIARLVIYLLLCIIVILNRDKFISIFKEMRAVKKK